MGCDIHMYAEVYDHVFGEWKKVGGEFTYGKEKMPTDQPYSGRNYILFGILAPECGRGEQYTSLDGHSKGLPHDLSPELQCLVDGWGDVAHSFGYYTLDELLEAGWNQTGTIKGVVELDEYKKLIEDGTTPTNYAKDVGGGRVVKLTEEQAKDLLATGKRDNALHYYVRASWTEPVRGAIQEFVDITIPALQKLGKPEDVRIVFWFDN